MYFKFQISISGSVYNFPESCTFDLNGYIHRTLKGTNFFMGINKRKLILKILAVTFMKEI